MSSSNKSNKSVSDSASASVPSSSKGVSFKDILTKNIAKTTARMSLTKPIAEVAETANSSTVEKSSASNPRKSYAAAVSSSVIPNPYRKMMPNDVALSPLAEGTPPTPPTAVLATQVSQEVRSYPTPPESVDPEPANIEQTTKVVSEPAKVVTGNIVSEEKFPKQVTFATNNKRNRSSEEPKKPSPSEYQALYNAGPKPKKRKEKQVPRRSSEKKVKTKGPQLPTRSSVAAKKRSKSPTPPLPDLNGTITKLSEHYNSEDVSSDDSESVDTFLKRVEGRAKKKSGVGSDSNVTSKKHSPDNYIKCKSLVTALIRTYCMKNGQYALESREGMVLGPVGKGVWRVAFFGDSQYSREMNSKRLTLLRRDYLVSDDESSDTSIQYSDVCDDDICDDNKSDDGVEIICVKKPPAKNVEVKMESSKDTTVKNEQDDDASETNMYYDFLDSDNEKRESEITRKRKLAQAKIDSFAGKRFRITAGKKANAESITWTLVKDDYQARHNLNWNRDRREHIGIRSAGIRNFLSNSDLPLAHLFLYLANPDGDATPVVARMNKAVEEDNTKKVRTSADIESSQTSYDQNIDELSEPDGFTPAAGSHASKARLTKYFDLKDLLTFYALFIGAADASARGCQLWSGGSRRENEVQEWSTLIPQVDFGIWMKYTRFKEVKKFFTSAWEEVGRKRAGDPWWQISGAIDEFNWIRKELLDFSNVIVFDEIMSGFRPRTTEKGAISPAPHLTFNKDKPCKMGHQAHNGSCGGTKSIGFLDLDRGAEGNKTLPYFKELGASASCCKRLVDGMSQRGSGGCRELIIADSWFGNMGSMRALTQPDPFTEKTRDVIFSIKQGYALFPKKAIEELLKDATPGCHAIFRGFDNVTQQHLWAIGWKFNSSTKCLKFLASDRAGSIAPSLNPYKIRFPDQFGNLTFRNIPRPGIVNEYYKYNNVIDVHNNYRQHNLGLEKKWITFNPMFRWLTTMTAIHVTDCYYLAREHNLLGPLRNTGVGGSPISITQFAGVLSRQLLTLSQRRATYSPRTRMPPFDPAEDDAGEHTFIDSVDGEEDEQFNRDEDHPDLPDLLEISSDAIIGEIRHGAYEVKGYMLDQDEKTHTVCLVHSRVLRGSKKKYRNPHICCLCRDKNTIVFCLECKKAFCYPLRRKNMQDADIQYQQMNSCFQKHIEWRKNRVAKRTSPRRSNSTSNDGYESAQV